MASAAIAAVSAPVRDMELIGLICRIAVHHLQPAFASDYIFACFWIAVATPAHQV